MYNLQNQLSRFKVQLGNNQDPPSKPTSKASITPVGRLVHAMRQVNKTILIFAQYYPYRSDNDLSAEKLCNHFYKQLHSSIGNFIDCLTKITLVKFESIKTDFNLEMSTFVSQRLNNLLLNCDNYFTESNEVEANSNKKNVTNDLSTKTNLNKQKNKVLKVARTPRISSASAVEFSSIKNDKIKPSKKSYEDLVQPSFVNTR